jgi:hypothetical protein
LKTITGDLWTFCTSENWIVVPTNGAIRYDGACVMGRGVALEAKRRFPKLPYELGERLCEFGNLVYTFPNYNILTFPVKHLWYEKANIELIEKSAKQLYKVVDRPVYMPRVGCGNGRLSWNDVRPILDKYLDDHFTLVELGGRNVHS